MWNGPVYGCPLTYPTILSLGCIQSICCSDNVSLLTLLIIGVNFAPLPVFVFTVILGKVRYGLLFGVTFDIDPSIISTSKPSIVSSIL